MTRLTTISILALAACGGSKSTPETPAAPATPTAYKDMNHEQREQFMKDVVMPKAKSLFVAFDPKFAEMDCKTCHGDGAEDGSFEMPDAKIDPLPNSKELFMEWAAKEPDLGRYAQFMSEQLEPEMAKLLGKEVFNPETNTGEFGCTACHMLVDASGKLLPVEPHH